eukprot:jgi/Chrpa1/2211/Chrysochromulina_OHIO_Genome00018818-RA
MPPKKTIDKKAKKSPSKAVEKAPILSKGEASASKLEALVKAGFPGATVKINEEKPRTGCFEVSVNGATILSLTDMPRPFTKLKALVMEDVAKSVILACH